jgi:hypothetical protein
MHVSLPTPGDVQQSLLGNMRFTAPICFGALLLLFLPLNVFASNVSVAQDVTIILPSDSSHYVLKASSSFDSTSVAVSPSSFSFAMNPGDTVTITSADNRTLSNSLNISTACGPPSSVVLTVQRAQTVTVTPGATCATASASSSGSGSGGNGPPVGLIGNSPSTPAQGAGGAPLPIVIASSSAPLQQLPSKQQLLIALYEQLITLLEKELSLLQPQT